jgi:nitrate reductase delta subunit
MIKEPVRGQIESFLHSIRDFSIADLEELYTRTFDINPIANLEIGWHLYGEAYERGSFLVKMRELLRAHHIEESTELPDHITHILVVLDKMEKGEAIEFSQQHLKPALDKILEGFANHPNPFAIILTALRTVVESYQVQGVESHV